MSQELAGKVAVITGGAQGLGRGMVELFAEEGASVVVGDIDPNGAETMRVLGDSCRFLRTDVADGTQLEALIDHAVAEFGRLDVLVNNAGVPSRMERLLDDDLDEWDHVMGINVRAVMRGTKHAAQIMRAQGGGSIVNISSIAGQIASFGVTLYRASKAAVIHFTKTAAIDLAEYGIRVNAILPGQIETRILTETLPSGTNAARKARLDAEMRAIMQSYQPIRRRGRPRDVAEAAVFLAGDRSTYITGVVLPVDGGICAGEGINYIDKFAELRRNILGADEA